MPRPDPAASAAPPEIDTDRDAVEQLAEEFIERRRRGERPSIEEFAARCPDRADEIRALFPTIAAMERWKGPSTSGTASRPTGPGLGAFRAVPERLGEFRLIREIGRGGMGVVFEAVMDSLGGKQVAVKVLPAGPGAGEIATRRFFREARLAASLEHPNIVPVYCLGEQDGLHYYAMRLIPGVGLDRVLGRLRGEPADPPADAAADHLLGGRAFPAVPERLGPAYWAGVARLGVQAAEALEFAHGAGVLHRDIKPANLLVDAEGHLWVADFGLAKLAGQDGLSRSGDLVGTLRYMAPEQILGRADARSDVYSLGLTLHELLTLRPALDADDRAGLLRRASGGEVPPARSLNPAVPADLDAIVARATAREPADRYPTAGALAADLGRFLAGEPVEARPPSAARRLARWAGRNRAVAALACASAALALVSAVFAGLYLAAPVPPPGPGGPGALQGPPPPRFAEPPAPPPPPPPGAGRVEVWDTPGPGDPPDPTRPPGRGRRHARVTPESGPPPPPPPPPDTDPGPSPDRDRDRGRDGRGRPPRPPGPPPGPARGLPRNPPGERADRPPRPPTPPPETRA